MWLLLRFWKLVRLSRRSSAGATIACLIAYALAASGRPAVSRAVLTASIYLFALILDREPDAPSALGAAALCLLAWQPALVLDIGFQLSFATVAAIILLLGAAGSREFEFARWGSADLVRQNYRPRTPFHRRLAKYGRWSTDRARSLFLLSLAAFLGSAPLVAHYFHQFSPISLAANLVVVPLVTLVLAGGLVLWPIGLVSAPAAASIAGWTVAPVLRAIEGAVSKVGQLPGASWSAGSPDWVEVAFFYLSIYLVALSLRTRDARPLAMVVAAAMSWVSWLAAGTLFPAPPRLTVTFLDVGQGDSIVVETPTSTHGVLVIDAGPPANPIAPDHAGPSQGMRTLLPYLRSRGIDRIDALLLTHADADHIGGAADLIDRMEVKRLLLGPQDYRNYRNFADFVASLDSNGAANTLSRLKSADRNYGRKTDTDLRDLPHESRRIADNELMWELFETARRRSVSVFPLSAGDRLDFGESVTADVLNPPRIASHELTELTELRELSENDRSVVLRLRFGKASFLLTGDCEEAAEGALARYASIKSDVLKVGHHGSATSTTVQFLAAAMPPYHGAAIISCGRNNPFGHPHEMVVSRLTAAHIPIFRTDRHGAVAVETNGINISIRSMLWSSTRTGN
jgi:competence protein ComEC